MGHPEITRNLIRKRKAEWIGHILRRNCFLKQVIEALGFCDRASRANCEVREKTNKMQQLDVHYQQFLNMFRASLRTSSGDQVVCYCMCCAALVLLDVVLAPYNAAPHNRYQPHPAVPAQHTTCSNTRLGLLKMCIMMPETF